MSKMSACASVLLLSTGTLFGCNQIVGIEKATFDPTVRGSSGGGGGSLEGPIDAPDFGCGTDILIDSALIRGCMLRVSCDPLLPAYTISNCITFQLQDLSPQESCSRNAESCDDIEDCIQRGYELDEEDTCSGPIASEWLCDGQGNAVRCGSDFPYQVDCEDLGASCVESDEQNQGAYGGCTPDSTFACLPGDEGSTFCVGDDLHTCTAELSSVGFDCSSIGERCIESTTGSARCGVERTDCAQPGTASCEDGSAVLCTEDAKEAVFDCSYNELQCETFSQDSDAFCLEDGCSLLDECKEECVDGTDGRVLQVCQGKQPIHIDCTEFGFEACGEGSFGGDETFAACL